VSKGISAPARSLVEVLRQENAALKQLDFSGAVSFVPAKECALLIVAGSVSDVPSDVIRLLADLAAENRMLLEHAIAVQTRIVQIVARGSTPSPRYPRNGVSAARIKPSRAHPMAVSKQV
jgi:hypothetical protein